MPDASTSARSASSAEPNRPTASWPGASSTPRCATAGSDPVHDVTPRAMRGQQVMAFETPVAVRRNGLVVIADKAEQAAAEELARAGGPARERLGLLGISSRRPVVVYYYASRRQLLRSLGEDPGEARIRFFSHAPLHLSDARTWTRDVGRARSRARRQGVVDAADAGARAHPRVHVGLVRGVRHAPTLLAEGLATAVEGGRTLPAAARRPRLRRSTFPLERRSAPRVSGRATSIAKVRLAYLEGASLVLYVLDRWDLRRSGSSCAR